jgi:hypothetical protein
MHEVHEQMCHMGNEKLSRCLGWEDGTNLHKSMPDCPCVSCLVAKIHKQASRKVALIKASDIMDHSSADLCVCMGMGIGRYTHYLYIVEWFSNYRWVFLLRSRGESEGRILEWKREAETHTGLILKNLHIDGGEMDTNKLELICRTNGTTLHVNTHAAHEQNGKAEVGIRVTNELERAARQAGGAERRFWPYSVPQSVLVQNHVPSARQLRQPRTNKDGTTRLRPLAPVEVWLKFRHPEGYRGLWNKIHPIFTQVVAQIPDELREFAHDDPGFVGTLLGRVSAASFTRVTESYKVLRHSDRKVIPVRHIEVFRNIYPMRAAMYTRAQEIRSGQDLIDDQFNLLTVKDSTNRVTKPIPIPHELDPDRAAFNPQRQTPITLEGPDTEGPPPPQAIPLPTSAHTSPVPDLTPGGAEEERKHDSTPDATVTPYYDMPSLEHPIPDVQFRDPSDEFDREHKEMPIEMEASPLDESENDYDYGARLADPPRASARIAALSALAPAPEPVTNSIPKFGK